MSSVGERLRERRLEHRWTLEDVAQRTRVRREYIEALEEGNYALLPADVQVRGYLRNYALVLGLPPAEILSLYQQDRGQAELVSIAPISRPPRTRSFVLPSLIFVLAATVFLGVGAVAIYFAFINPAAPTPTPTVRQITPTAILPTATPTVAFLMDTPTPTATPRPTAGAYEGIEAVLEVTAPCWVRVTADGTQVYEGTLSGGTTRTFRAERELTIRMGNAGGVRVTLNGEDLGVQGLSGQVVTKNWTAEP